MSLTNRRNLYRCFSLVILVFCGPVLVLPDRASALAPRTSMEDLAIQPALIKKALVAQVHRLRNRGIADGPVLGKALVDYAVQLGAQMGVEVRSVSEHQPFGRFAHVYSFRVNGKAVHIVAVVGSRRVLAVNAYPLNLKESKVIYKVALLSQNAVAREDAFSFMFLPAGPLRFMLIREVLTNEKLRKSFEQSEDFWIRDVLRVWIAIRDYLMFVGQYAVPFGANPDRLERFARFLLQDKTLLEDTTAIAPTVSRPPVVGLLADALLSLNDGKTLDAWRSTLPPSALPEFPSTAVDALRVNHPFRFTTDDWERYRTPGRDALKEAEKAFSNFEEFHRLSRVVLGLQRNSYLKSREYFKAPEKIEERFQQLREALTVVATIASTMQIIHKADVSLLDAETRRLYIQAQNELETWADDPSMSKSAGIKFPKTFVVLSVFFAVIAVGLLGFNPWYIAMWTLFVAFAVSEMKEVPPSHALIVRALPDRPGYDERLMKFVTPFAAVRDRRKDVLLTGLLGQLFTRSEASKRPYLRAWVQAITKEVDVVGKFNSNEPAPIKDCIQAAMEKAPASFRAAVKTLTAPELADPELLEKAAVFLRRQAETDSVWAHRLIREWRATRTAPAIVQEQWDRLDATVARDLQKSLIKIFEESETLDGRSDEKERLLAKADEIAATAVRLRLNNPDFIVLDAMGILGENDAEQEERLAVLYEDAQDSGSAVLIYGTFPDVWKAAKKISDFAPELADNIYGLEADAVPEAFRRVASIPPQVLPLAPMKLWADILDKVEIRFRQVMKWGKTSGRYRVDLRLGGMDIGDKVDRDSFSVLDDNITMGKFVVEEEYRGYGFSERIFERLRQEFPDKKIRILDVLPGSEVFIKRLIQKKLIDFGPGGVPAQEYLVELDKILAERKKGTNILNEDKKYSAFLGLAA